MIIKSGFKRNIQIFGSATVLRSRSCPEPEVAFLNLTFYSPLHVKYVKMLNQELEPESNDFQKPEDGQDSLLIVVKGWSGLSVSY